MASSKSSFLVSTGFLLILGLGTSCAEILMAQESAAEVDSRDNMAAAKGGSAIQHGGCNFTKHLFKTGPGPAGGTGDTSFVPVEGASALVKPKFGSTCVRITLSAEGFTNDFGTGGDRVLYVQPRIEGSTDGIYPSAPVQIGHPLVNTTGTSAENHTVVWTAPSSSGGRVQIFYRTKEPSHRSYILRFHLVVEQEP